MGLRFMYGLANVNSAEVLREQIQVMSGGTAEFKSGDVLSDVTYQVLPMAQTQQGQVVSQISRRTVGLQVQLQAVCFGSNWLVSVDLDDSTLAGSSETTTHYTGSRVVSLGEPYFLLASFTRKQSQRSKDGVPVLSSIPVIKPLFTRSQTTSNLRNVMVVARPVAVSSEGSGQVPGLQINVAHAGVADTTNGAAAPPPGRWVAVPPPSPDLPGRSNSLQTNANAGALH